MQNLGNDAFIKTEVHVGVHKRIKIKIAELEKLVDQKQMLLNNINAGIKQIEQMMGSAADGMNLEERSLRLRSGQKLRKQQSLPKIRRSWSGLRA